MSDKNCGKSRNESTSNGARKDDRMQELQAEIARLEQRSKVIRKDRAEYELKFQRALLRGVSRVPTEPIKSLKHPVAAEREDLNLTSTSSSDTDVDDSLSPVFAEQNSSVQKQSRGSKNLRTPGNRKKNKK